MKAPRVSLAVALGRTNRAIGKDGRLPWRIPDDLKRFKELTMGHPVIMGRKTFESILGYLGKPLPGRTTIVLTRDPDFTYEDIMVVHALPEALERAKNLDTEEIFIGGGGALYAEALPFIDRLYLTLVDDESEGDTFFPPYDAFTKKISEEKRQTNDGLRYTWLTLER